MIDVGSTRHILEFKKLNMESLTLDERLEFSLAKGTKHPGMYLEELLVLNKSLETFGNKQINILETGMQSGVSTRFFLTQVLKYGGKLFSIEQNIQQDFKDYMVVLGLWDRINVFNFDSRFVFLDNNISIDFLNLDSGHHLGLVLSEYLHFRLYLKQNSLIGFHDINNKGVAFAINIIKKIDILEEVEKCDTTASGYAVYRLLGMDNQNMAENAKL